MTPSATASDTAVFAAWERLRRPVWLFDPVGLRGVYANAAARVLWGAATLEELLARDFSQLSPAVRARTDRLAQATAAGEIVSERWTFYPQGRPVTVQAAISTFRLQDGRGVLLFEAAPADVEEGERRAGEALRHASSIITLIDADGAAVFENPAAYAAYGWAEMTVPERFVDPAEGRALIAQAREGLAAAALCRMRTAAGECWHHVDARPATDPVTGGAVVLLNEQDVTAQIEAERAAAEAESRAEVATAKSLFLANMSHELRTPLQAVLGFAGLLRAGPLSERQADQADRILDAGKALLGAVNDMILLSELDRGEVTLKSERVEPARAARDAVERLADAAAVKGLTLSVEAADALPAVVADGEKLGLILHHYLSNAVKFTPAGGATVSATVVADGDGGARLELAVTDTGPGVDPAAVEPLFDRFVQGDMGRTKRVGGGGLGLAVCRSLAELMGGEAGVDSTPGQGARFWLRVTLPLAEPEAGEEAAGGGLNILYADDHEANRMLVQAMLATQGHRCVTVDDGAEAVAAASPGGWDLILMDIQMPGMDGVEATRRIRLADRTTPIVALTANTLGEQVATYRAVGMDDYIAKPVGMVELLTKAAQWGCGGRTGERTAVA